MLANTFLKPQGVLVSCDYSEKMVDKVRANLEESDYAQVPGNKYAMAEKDLAESENFPSLDLDGIIAAQGEFRKFVFGCRANNELLPFKDASFTAYLASLSVMIVDNARNQFEEAYRVLQPGSTAVFTIWAHRSESVQFTIVDSAFAEHLPAEAVEKMKSAKTNFDLYETNSV